VCILNLGPFDDGEIIPCMARIKDQDASIFKEASLSVLDTFSDDEARDIEVLAQELKAMLDAAKKRQQDRLRKVG
jgi:hypothetical protein